MFRFNALVKASFPSQIQWPVTSSQYSDIFMIGGVRQSTRFAWLVMTPLDIKGAILPLDRIYFTINGITKIKDIINWSRSRKIKKEC